jgi:hypothetical protein
VNHVWILQGFDRVSELEVEAIKLRGVTDDDVRRILGLSPDDDVTGGFDVTASAAHELERVIGRPLRADLDYQLGPFAPAA